MKKKVFSLAIEYLLVFLIVANTAFIFFQSVLSPVASESESDFVGGIIASIFPPDRQPGKFIQENLRKIAHFAEFMLLGIWTSVYTVFCAKRKAFFAALLPFGLTTAALDETIQIFSGRGPSVKDVCIDFSGYLSAVLLVISVYLLIRSYKKYRSDKRP